MKNSLYALLLIPALATLPACQPEKAGSGYSGPDTIWKLEAIDGKAFGARATLTFPEAGKVAGQAPCNRYFGEMKAPYPQFDAGMVASTKMACQDLEAEGQFFSALNEMNRTDISGNTLVLSNDAGREMIFKAE
ncbi:META domain-containing protein [Lentibacter sp. XHP0401]|uniref:META domain-containing protein n=1 Tax=Lentibacter sp. XHP0401 TaxID=2984334 RepID=UPI0021E91F33|nr:META domain-containing protein [Lentibacter sp. XHP0401]MCV2893078.1 META domain-containing protein [Lentibacter sp. XHP0401]